MSTCVVDASVAAKWLMQEIHSDAAERLLSPGNRLLVPDFIFNELGNVVWKKVRAKSMTESEGIELISTMDHFQVSIFTSRLLTRSAFLLAVQVDRSFYDSLYLALAISQKCQLVTADRKFYNAIHAGPLAKHVRWIEDRF